MKYTPDFNHAPPWSKAWAVDADRRTAIWYDRVPTLNLVNGYWEVKVPDYDSEIDDNFFGLEPGQDWKDSLVVKGGKDVVTLPKKELVEYIQNYVKDLDLKKDGETIIHILLLRSDRTTLEVLYQQLKNN